MLFAATALVVTAVACVRWAFLVENSLVVEPGRQLLLLDLLLAAIVLACGYAAVGLRGIGITRRCRLDRASAALAVFSLGVAVLLCARFQPMQVSPLVWVLATILVASFLEEVLFRGVLQTLLRRWMSPIRSLLVTAVVFLGYHALPMLVGLPVSTELQVVFGSGLVLGALRLRTGSIWIPWAHHFLWNVLAKNAGPLVTPSPLATAAAAVALSLAALALVPWRRSWVGGRIVTGVLAIVACVPVALQFSNQPEVGWVSEPRKQRRGSIEIVLGGESQPGSKLADFLAQRRMPTFGELTLDAAAEWPLRDAARYTLTRFVEESFLPALSDGRHTDVDRARLARYILRVVIAPKDHALGNNNCMVVRADAMSALDQLYRPVPRYDYDRRDISEKLIAALKAADPGRWQDVSLTLSWMVDSTPETRSELLAGLTDSRAHVRAACARVLVSSFNLTPDEKDIVRRTLRDLPDSVNSPSWTDGYLKQLD